MWNMNFTIPTLIMLAIISGAYFSRRRLPLRANRAFEILLVISILTIVADIASTKMDELGQAYPDWALRLVNYLFFVLFLNRSFLLFWFPSELLDAKNAVGHKKRIRFILLAEQLFLLVGSVTGWIFRIEDGAYISGPLYPFINLQFLAWIACGFISLIKLGHHISMHKTGFYFYFTLLLLGVTLRTLLPHVVIMNLFCMFAIQVIYLLYLNPDQYLDDVTLLFNDAGWKKVLDEATIRDDFSMVGFGIRNYAAIRETRGDEKVSYALRSIGDWIHHTWPHMASYYLENGIFVLSSTKPFDQDAILQGIDRRFSMPWASESGEYYLKTNMVVMRPCHGHVDSSILNDAVADVYPMLVRQDPTNLIEINGERIQKHVRKMKLEDILRDALANDQLEMFLQPIVNAENGRVDGAEALCRLKNPDGGYIFPDEFMPLAQKTGSIGVLGTQMFRHACKFMSREDVRFSNLKWINVNVAPEQFRNPRLLQEFVAILEEYHLEPDQIHLEITEETMIDRTLLHDSMAAFRANGFIFSMDDFGSSYSNMIRLQQNHFSSVKIDRDFTWSYFKHKTALLPDIIHTCHDLGMKVVTEGVETKEMVDGIREIHGDFIQGYYYSKPIPAEDFREKYVRQKEEP